MNALVFPFYYSSTEQLTPRIAVNTVTLKGRHNFETVDNFTYLSLLVTGDKNGSEEVTNCLIPVKR